MHVVGGPFQNDTPIVAFLPISGSVRFRLMVVKSRTITDVIKPVDVTMIPYLIFVSVYTHVDLQASEHWVPL